MEKNKIMLIRVDELEWELEMVSKQEKDVSTSKIDGDSIIMHPNLPHLL